METAEPKVARSAAKTSTTNTPSLQRKALGSAVPNIQTSSLRVSSPSDPAEKEADTTAKKVMRIAIPESSIAYVRTPAGGVFRQVNDAKSAASARPWQSPYIARFAGTGLFRAADTIQRKMDGMPDISSNIAAEIQGAKTTGKPLPANVRRFMEPRFKADFSKVKIHTDDKAAKLNKQVNAKAFAVGNQVFFGKNQFQPETPRGKELIAHELTHTIQQGGAVQRSEDTTVTQQAPVQIQRGLVDEALDYFADKANIIPFFRLFTIIIGVNPINMSSVDRSAANILRAIVEVMPGGGLITKALDAYGIFDKIGAWVEGQMKSLGLSGSSIRQAVMKFIDTLGPTDVFRLGSVWDRAKAIFTDPIDRIITFAKSLAGQILDFIKDAILKPIGALASKTPGWDMLKVIIGSDPITGEAFPPTAENLVGAFMKLIGQDEIFQNLQKSKALPRAFAWFKGAMGELKGFVAQIPALFMKAIKSLTITDLVVLPMAFAKVAGVFGDFLGKFTSWAGKAMFNLLEILFDVFSPGAFGYVKKTGAALKSILQNPIPFVGNLVNAAKLGFTNFGANIGTHLKTGLIDWLTGSLEGVYIPKALSLMELVKFVFSVLGISWANIRAKLVKVIGNDAVTVLEKTFKIVATLVTQGPAAAWEEIKSQLASLRDSVISGIISFVVDAIVKKAVPKLIAMFIPGAGFLSAILSIYDTVMVFVQKLSKIYAVVTGFINSIVAIAAGQIGPAAKRVEGILANLLSLAISFLAGFLGLGKVTDKIMGVVNKLRATVDKAIDWLINFIVTTAKKLFAALFGKKDKKKDNDEQLNAAVQAAEKAVDDDPFMENIAGRLSAIRAQYGLRTLSVTKVSDDNVRINAEINPKRSADWKLGNKQRLEKCIASRKHGKKVETVGHGNPKAAAAKAKERLEKFRADLSGLRTEVASLVIRIEAAERLARARGVPEAEIPALTAPARQQVRETEGQISGTENNIRGIEHEQLVAKADKAILRNVKVRCVICKVQITELDQISDPNFVLEAKASAAAVDVDTIQVQQKVVKQLFGQSRQLVLALPKNVDMAALRAKFKDKDVPLPPVRLY